MSLSFPDPFERFATECGLRVSMERVTLAPRDVLAPPDETDQCYVITLTGPGGREPVRLIFAIPMSEATPPSLRDAIWWLAGDARAVERSGGDVRRWAASHGYAVADAGVTPEFEHHVRQARALEAALGVANYRRLLALYEAEVSPTRPPPEEE